MMGVAGIHQSKTVAISCENLAFIHNKKQTMYLMMGVPSYFYIFFSAEIGYP